MYPTWGHDVGGSISYQPDSRMRGEDGTRLLPRQHFLRTGAIYIHCLWVCVFGPSKDYYLYHLGHEYFILAGCHDRNPLLVTCHGVQATLKFVFSNGRVHKKTQHWLINCSYRRNSWRTPVPAAVRNEWIASSNVEKLAPSSWALTFSPAAGGYSPCRTSSSHTGQHVPGSTSPPLGWI